MVDGAVIEGTDEMENGFQINGFDKWMLKYYANNEGDSEDGSNDEDDLKSNDNEDDLNLYADKDDLKWNDNKGDRESRNIEDDLKLNEKEDDLKLDDNEENLKFIDGDDGFQSHGNGDNNRRKDDEDSDDTLPVLPETMVEFSDQSSSSSSSSESESESSSEDETSKLLSSNKQLKCELEKIKKELEDSKRDMILANNTRIAQKDQLLSLQKEHAVKLKYIESLEKKFHASRPVM